MKTVEEVEGMSKEEIVHYLYERVYDLAEELIVFDKADSWPGLCSGEQMGKDIAIYVRKIVSKDHQA